MLIGLSHSAVFQAALESFQTNAEELAGHARDLGTADVHAAAEKGSTLSVNRVGKLL